MNGRCKAAPTWRTVRLRNFITEWYSKSLSWLQLRLDSHYHYWQLIMRTLYGKHFCPNVISTDRFQRTREKNWVLMIPLPVVTALFSTRVARLTSNFAPVLPVLSTDIVKLRGWQGWQLMVISLSTKSNLYHRHASTRNCASASGSTTLLSSYGTLRRCCIEVFCLPTKPFATGVVSLIKPCQRDSSPSPQSRESGIWGVAG